MVNLSSTLYVATGSGTSSTTDAMPTCLPAGCTTGADGSIPGWYNAGGYTSDAATNAIWPGPQGQFTLGGPLGYRDNGYLALWDDGSTGYIAAMTTFLQNLHASFPFTISAHNGPPANANGAYADSEAIIASAHGIGFGMQSVDIGDSQALATGQFPTSTQNWVHNFVAFPAPVHHLQSFNPGNPTHAAGFPITNIGVSSDGTATINCATDCSIFSSSPIFVEGSSNPLLNGIQTVSCPPTG